MTQAATPYVLELVVFHLKEGTNEASFLESAQTLTEFLRTEVPGFQSRNLMHTADHSQWTDMIYWSTMETALAAMKQLHSAPEFRDFASMIDSKNIQMKHLIAVESASGNVKEGRTHA
ncbi:hypothetical protein NYE80_25820 [Paenibacillus sp. FSL H7-0357]|uniref:hypothetical protein n=1 Tax=Paenibacillus sp. FSL H7-0357 TaxID=1536774 RepID=UPI00068FF78A|nr:hypothetical protein [Paenibacillus sp. FSL H7-0357]